MSGPHILLLGKNSQVGVEAAAQPGACKLSIWYQRRLSLTRATLAEFAARYHTLLATVGLHLADGCKLDRWLGASSLDYWPSMALGG